MIAANSSPAAPERTTLSEIARRTHAMLERQVCALECQIDDTTYSEGNVKALTALVKMIQTTAELVQQQERLDEDRNARPEDILEFRRQLAERIAALGADGAD
jgi:hypothetical protein